GAESREAARYVTAADVPDRRDRGAKARLLRSRVRVEVLDRDQRRVERRGQGTRDAGAAVDVNPSHSGTDLRVGEPAAGEVRLRRLAVVGRTHDHVRLRVAVHVADLREEP